MARYRSNSGGWRRIMRGQGARDAVAAPAERMAAHARLAAPVSSGYYRDHIEVEDSTGEGEAASSVVAKAPYSTFVEARDNVLGQTIQ